MSLKHQLKQAEKIIQTLNFQDTRRLEKICREIQAAEVRLLEKSETLMRRCMERCAGICCRNVQLDLIINYWDFLFILIAYPNFKQKILECLEKENPFFSTDCIFLTKGAGPCIFPYDARPEVCLVTFCDTTDPIKKEIREVKRKFFKLTWFVNLRRAKSLFHKLF